MPQTVKTPRFWMNELEFLNFNNYSIGQYGYNVVNNTLPVNTSELTLTTFQDKSLFDLNLPYVLNNPYLAILGHEGLTSVDIADAQILNTGVQINASDGAYKKGWSLMELTGNPTQIAVNTTAKIGSLFVGSYFDVPHSADLALTLTHDYSGVKKTITRGGSTLVNTQYHKNPKWGTLGAWEIERQNTDTNLSRSGRRIWDLSFSYLSDANIHPDTLNLTNMNDFSSSDGIDGGLNTGTDFYGQVIQRAANAIPFIFSPDNTSTALDNFYICMFDQQNFSFSQTAPALYSIKLRVMECW